MESVEPLSVSDTPMPTTWMTSGCWAEHSYLEQRPLEKSSPSLPGRTIPPPPPPLPVLPAPSSVTTPFLPTHIGLHFLLCTGPGSSLYLVPELWTDSHIAGNLWGLSMERSPAGGGISMLFLLMVSGPGVHTLSSLCYLGRPHPVPSQVTCG